MAPVSALELVVPPEPSFVCLRARMRWLCAVCLPSWARYVRPKTTKVYCGLLVENLHAYQTTADLCAATMQAVEEFWVAFAPRERCLARVGSSQTPARTVRAPPALLHQQSHLITRERPWRHRGSGDCGRRTIDRSQTRRWRAPLRCHLPSAAAGSSWVIGMGWGRGVDPTVEALNMAVARHPRW